MREYVFLLEYDRGIHPVRDVFIDHPEVVVTALDISLARDRGWRVERMTGPEHALDAVEAVYFDEQCNDCTYPTHTCDAAAEYQVLEREPTARTIYRHVMEMSYCHAVSYLALKTLGDGLEWRVLVPTERNVDAFHRALREDLPEGVSLELRRAGTPEGWLHANSPQHGSELPYEQREAIETARRMGYYEHPRDASLETIAAELDLPVTTLRYRLRRAEAWATAIALEGYGFDSSVGSELERTEEPITRGVPVEED
ncbi:transcriptional regulator [Halobacteriales archaeon QH_7_69_31]|nr:MAG: transcriptional regulator [Halobacteriales archaeon QH_7_69_31]